MKHPIKSSNLLISRSIGKTLFNVSIDKKKVVKHKVIKIKYNYSSNNINNRNKHKKEETKIKLKIKNIKGKLYLFMTLISQKDIMILKIISKKKEEIP